jgi:pSer/pThr/pTyr-binding forkhead associated (FHA) protein
MPYITVTANGEEIDRRELVGPIIIGRSPHCDVAIRDILLSREHCRLDPVRNREKHRYRLVDLGSRNGSHVNYKKVTDYVLVDGDTVRIGRTKITFKTDAFVPLPETARKQKLVRPTDPHDALSGTVADFVYADHDASEDFDATPSPMSRATDGPVAKGGGSSADGLSPGWSANLATATQPRRLARPIPRKAGEIAVGSRTSHTDLSLQVHNHQLPFLQVVPELPARRPHRLRSALLFTAGVAIATGLVLVSGWVMMK